jgi:hypothetical protein
MPGTANLEAIRTAIAARRYPSGTFCGVNSQPRSPVKLRSFFTIYEHST